MMRVCLLVILLMWEKKQAKRNFKMHASSDKRAKVGIALTSFISYSFS
jgi:hypothetical protein